MTDEQRVRIISYVTTLNSTIEAESESENESGSLLGFVLDEVVDRALLYLNATDLDPRVERIIARVVVAVYLQSSKNQSATDTEQAISSVSDNGQSVSYRNEVKNYLATADDGELFGGFAKLLSRFRRADVVTD